MYTARTSRTSIRCWGLDSAGTEGYLRVGATAVLQTFVSATVGGGASGDGAARGGGIGTSRTLPIEQD